MDFWSTFGPETCAHCIIFFDKYAMFNPNIQEMANLVH